MHELKRLEDEKWEIESKVKNLLDYGNPPESHYVQVKDLMAQWDKVAFAISRLTVALDEDKE